MSLPNILSDFKPSSPDRLIIYVSGLLMILSLFLPIQNYDSSSLRVRAAFIFLAGVFFWAVKKSIDDYVAYKVDTNTVRNEHGLYANTLSWKNVLTYVYVILTAVILLFP